MSASKTATYLPMSKYMNVSFFGVFTCLTTLVLAFLFKQYLINLLTYLEEKASSNIFEFHLMLLILFILMSLPVLSPYIICILICSYVYGFVYGMPIIILYTFIGMSVSFFMCRYFFYEFAHTKVKNLVYLNVICSLIQSNEKGYKIIFLSRLMPLPFGLANLAFSVTNVNFSTYIISSVIGLLPSQLILCYVGSTLKSMSDVLVNENTAKTGWIVFLIQLIIAFFVMFYILRAAKLELHKHIRIEENKVDNDISNNSDENDIDTYNDLDTNCKTKIYDA